jgi:4-hydroxy-tetrahydrodipicolinate synthase
MAAFGGVNVAAITPRREGPEIDFAAAFELLDFLSATGIGAIALLGSTGEFTHFSLDERARLVKLAVKRSRVPVIAGVGHSTFDGAVYLAREAAGAGAAGLLLMPPYFFRYSQEQVRDFYLCFAEQIGDLAPVLLYNIPQFTTGIEPETAAGLLATGSFAGIKDSSGNWAGFMRLKEARRNNPFTLLAGNDLIYTPARLAGADGLISGCACAVPELLVAIDRAIAAGDAAAAWRLDARLHEFIRQVEQFPAPIAVREAAAVRGVKAGAHAVPCAPRRLAVFREWFQGWLPDVLKESKHA